MDQEIRFLPKTRRPVTHRLCNVSSHKTELLEIRSNDPKLHILFVPGNPGVVAYYKEFIESLYEMLGGSASITAIGHISHTIKNWDCGRLFSLQDQIEHKVGHSIGAYITLEMFKRSPEKIMYCICLYPFLALNPESPRQSKIRKMAASTFMSTAISSFAAFLGILPRCATKGIVMKYLGESSSPNALDVTCSYLLQYHTVRNVLFMALTEFEKLSDAPDWAFMRLKQHQMAFLFGLDDHWGPISMFKEIANQVPNVNLYLEREGHTHSFCCNEAGSIWVAQHVANLIKNHKSSPTQ
ncbi:Lipid droplet-associated hydrolase [Dillenia turbinata]|uniref:Lipid droplet-associated hydrolase n=1 Tax=Dillenia turbinata TaxID=194707 RepID=A0AAN8W704_9MAGN